METFKGHWAGPDGCRLVSELRRRHQNSILNRFLLKTSFHCLLSITFVAFSIHWPLSPSPAASSVSWCWSCFVCSGLTYEIYIGGGPSIYIYYKWCCPVLIHHYTLYDNLEHPMDYKLSLLPNVFPYLTLSYLTLPYLTLPFLTWSYLSLPYITLPYLTLPYLILPYLTLLYPTLPYHTLPYLTWPYLTLPYFILPYLTIPYLTLPYHTLTIPYLTSPWMWTYFLMVLTDVSLTQND